MTPAEIEAVARILNTNPGMTQEQAIAIVKQMPPGELVSEGTSGRLVGQSQPFADFGAGQGSVQHVSVPPTGVGTPGSMGADGQFQAQQQQPQSHPMCGRGTMFDGTQCVAVGF